MKEKQIFFDEPMIPRLLNGKQTMTRRPVTGKALSWLEEFTPDFVAHPENSLCPFGKIGGRLWVRETFVVTDKDGIIIEGPLTGFDKKKKGAYAFYQADPGNERFDGKWRPSIHMPRWAARLTLEITDVRVEKLHAISEDDAIREGFHGPYTGTDLMGISQVGSSPRECFAKLWDIVHSKPGAYLENPWVWVISFKRVNP